MRRKPFTWLPRLLFKEPAVSPTAELRSRHARSSRVAHNGPAVYRTSPQFRHSCQLLHSNGAIVVAKPGVHANAAPSTQQSPAAHSVTLRVTPIDELFGRAKAAGARVLAEPADHMYGERQCSFLDPWGHPWTLSETIFDSDPADWGGELLVE